MTPHETNLATYTAAALKTISATTKVASLEMFASDGAVVTAIECAVELALLDAIVVADIGDLNARVSALMEKTASAAVLTHDVCYHETERAGRGVVTEAAFVAVEYGPIHDAEIAGLYVCATIEQGVIDGADDALEGR